MPFRRWPRPFCEAKAIQNVRRRSGAGDDYLECVETAEDTGLPVDGYRELANALRTLGVSVGDDVITSIRSIEEIE